MLQCGLLGEKLKHSYSPMIHAQLADYAYRLYERAPEELDLFLRSAEWDGLNVTIPYKKTVVPYCDVLSPQARQLGSVNTLVHLPDGRLYGDNTDYFGFSCLVDSSGIRVAGRRAVVLGSGGASVTVCAVLHAMGAQSVAVISRRGEDNYQNLDRHADAQIIVNTTPLGMYPDNGKAAVDLRRFPKCEGVFDLIYNPARTALLMQAEELGIPCRSGLRMLVAQAARSCERFTGSTVDASRIGEIEQTICAKLQNIVLLGMPGCGKSTVAAALGKRLGRPVYDSDALVAQRAGMTIPEIFSRDGEERFRALESEVLSELGKLSGAVISTGGGCVTRAENYPLLHQNGRIFWLQRALESLPAEGRPLSRKHSPQELYARRERLYERFADRVIDNNGSVEQTAERIEESLQ